MNAITDTLVFCAQVIIAIPIVVIVVGLGFKLLIVLLEFWVRATDRPSKAEREHRKQQYDAIREERLSVEDYVRNQRSTSASETIPQTPHINTMLTADVIPVGTEVSSFHGDCSTGSCE